ncbi:MAG TPA: hypothetical protein VJV21_07945 [Pyrinomonadaceae bacterium]|nr:hypothetical protein [Pyrinomonadaceae bacterium]
MVQQTRDNPPQNALPSEIDETVVAEAIAASGYPLQLRVASFLSSRFKLVEEWAFKDRTTGELRSLDLYATMQLSDTGVVRPGLTLLIECKRSRLPYVFFRTATPPEIQSFPAIHGLRAETLTTHAPNAQMQMPIGHLLGLGAEPFATKGPDFCATFSKCARKGKDVELSGVDAFNNIVLPLVSALRYDADHRRLSQPQPMYFPTVTLAICVLQAPMLLTEVVSGYRVLHPWVRIIREEAAIGNPREQYAIDVVHVDFLDKFLSEHLLPFVEVFRERAVGRFSMFHNLTAHVPSLSGWAWRDVRGPDGA